MLSRSELQKVRGYAVLFFIYGSLAQWFMLWRIARLTGSKAMIVNHPVEAPVLLVLSGFSVSWFMVRLLRQTPEPEAGHHLRKILGTVLKGAIYGVLATSLTLALFCILASIVLGLGSPIPLRGVLLASFFAMIGLGAPTVDGITNSLPFAVIYGSVGGAIIALLRTHYNSWLPPVERPKGMGTESFALGIIGLTVCWLPRYGAPVSIVAVALGALTFWRISKGRAKGKFMAGAGVALGIVVLAFILYTLTYTLVLGR